MLVRACCKQECVVNLQNRTVLKGVRYPEIRHVLST